MYYNQSIGGSELNNIAIDLGATTFSTFEDDGTYAVDKLNEITSALVGPGVLNKWNLCKVSYSGNVVTVETGVVVLPSGAKYRFNTSKTVLQVTPPAYVYVAEDSEHKVKLYVQDTLPTTSDTYTQLGYIDASGTVSELASICQAKVEALSTGTPVTYEVEANTTSITINKPAAIGMYAEITELGYMKKKCGLLLITEHQHVLSLSYSSTSSSSNYYIEITYSGTDNKISFKYTDGTGKHSGCGDHTLSITLF